jgi:hypothetical protein
MDVGIILLMPLVLIRHTRQDGDVHAQAVEPTPAASSETRDPAHRPGRARRR